MSAKKKPTWEDVQRALLVIKQDLREITAMQSCLSHLLERTCVHCGCTDSKACLGGCSWSAKHRATLTGVCSRCVRKERKLVDSL